MNNEFAKTCVSSMGYLFLRMAFDKENYSNAVITELGAVVEELMKDNPDSDLITEMTTEFVEGNYISTRDVNPYEIVEEVICENYGFTLEEVKPVIKALRQMRTKDTSLIALIGRSGVGKTSVAKYLEDKYDWTQVESYTTRPKRFGDERGHRFITEEQFNRIPREEIMAYMKYRDYQYGATGYQLDEANIYVVDPGGYEMLKKKYKNRKIVSIKLTASKDTLVSRMTKRGTNEQELMDRIEKDNAIFDNFQTDIEINTDNLSISEVGEDIVKSFQNLEDCQEVNDKDSFLIVDVSNIEWDATSEEMKSNNLPEATTIIGAFKLDDYCEGGEPFNWEKLEEDVSDWLTETYKFTIFECSINVSI